MSCASLTVGGPDSRSPFVMTSTLQNEKAVIFFCFFLVASFFLKYFLVDFLTVYSVMIDVFLRIAQFKCRKMWIFFVVSLPRWIVLVLSSWWIVNDSFCENIFVACWNQLEKTFVLEKGWYRLYKGLKIIHWSYGHWRFVLELIDLFMSIVARRCVCL